jgi:predicted phage terminase large subunit-like protein
MANEQAIADAIYRSDFHAFTRKVFEHLHPNTPYQGNWHLEAMAFQLERCRKGENQRLIMTMPPRHLKSIVTTVAYIAWVLGQDPSEKIMCISHGEDLALELARFRRSVMQSAWYRRLFPKTRISKSKDTEWETVTTKNGYCITTTVGGSFTGRGANYIIIDDALKAADAESDALRTRVNRTYQDAIYSRLNEKKTSRIIITMQRLHIDDLVGFVREKESWFELTLPAIAECQETFQLSDDESYTREIGEPLHKAREDRDEFDRIKANIGSRNFSAQYLQKPVPAEGAMVKRSWLKYIDEEPDVHECEHVMMAWDTAIETGENNSYSAYVVGGLKEHTAYILEAGRVRLEIPDLEKRIIAKAKQWDPALILIEKAASGHAILHSLSRRTALPLKAVKPWADKKTRMVKILGLIESGRVVLPKEADWLAEFESELLSFPSGKYDDQVDALSYLIERIFRPREPQLESRVLKFGSRRGGDRYFQRTGIPIFG